VPLPFPIEGWAETAGGVGGGAGGPESIPMAIGRQGKITNEAECLEEGCRWKCKQKGKNKGKCRCKCKGKGKGSGGSAGGVSGGSTAGGSGSTTEGPGGRPAGGLSPVLISAGVSSGGATGLNEGGPGGAAGGSGTGFGTGGGAAILPQPIPVGGSVFGTSGATSGSAAILPQPFPGGVDWGVDWKIGYIHNMNRCPNVTEMKDQLEGFSRDERCVMNALGWMDDDGKVVAAEVQSLPILEEVTEDSIKSCARNHPRRVQNFLRWNRCSDLSQDDIDMLKDTETKLAKMSCLRHQFLRSCQQHVTKQVNDYFQDQSDSVTVLPAPGK